MRIGVRIFEKGEVEQQFVIVLLPLRTIESSVHAPIPSPQQVLHLVDTEAHRIRGQRHEVRGIVLGEPVDNGAPMFRANFGLGTIHIADIARAIAVPRLDDGK